ncbi:MAG TPA: hypothetical protein VJM08_09050 [Anaerolineales bacterium]|nr:hypothetical protein [Anaerolineales bacterium]
MLTYYSDYICTGFFLFTLLLYVCVGYAYRLNAKRAADDPKKRDIPLGVVLLAPITWPFLLIGAISLFVIRVLIYGIFLVLFMVALLVIRKPVLLTWLKQTAAWVGDRLLGATIFLIKVPFGDLSKKTQTT